MGYMCLLRAHPFPSAVEDAGLAMSPLLVYQILVSASFSKEEGRSQDQWQCRAPSLIHTLLSQPILQQRLRMAGGGLDEAIDLGNPGFLLPSITSALYPDSESKGKLS